MAQHFLLSAQARSLSVRQVCSLTNDQAWRTFKELRWGTGDEVACPNCGGVARHWFIAGRKQWRCKCCRHTFSVTSGTVFAFHKLPIKVYLAAIAIYSNAAKGISALQLARDLGVQYKTAFVMAHKIRECLLSNRTLSPMSGEVHIDGAYVNGHVRPANKKADRVDRRLAENQKPDKRCVLVFRSKNGKTKQGADKTLTFVLKSENQSYVFCCHFYFL